MKKHKSVVAILLAVMMIFTMMPMMAFASVQTKDGDEVITWADDFSTVTVKGVTYNTVRTWDKDTGLITARASSEGMSASAAVDVPTVSTQFYDLAGAKLLVNGQTATKFTQGEFNTVFSGNDKLVLAMPSYAKNKDGKDYASTAATDKTTGAMSLTGWTITIDKQPAEIEAGKTTDQTVACTAVITLTNAAAADGKVVPFKVGPNPTSSLTFLGVPMSANKALFYIDKVTTDGAFTQGTKKVDYDGAAHTVVMSDMPGYSVAYSVLNKATGAYDAATPSVTNVADSQVVKAVVTNNSVATDKAEFNFTIGVNQVVAPKFGFITDKSTDTTAEYDVADNVEYDPYSYVAVKPVTANKAAVAADEAKWMEYFKDYYDVTATPGKLDAATVALAIEPKDLDAAATKELTAKYKDFVANYSGKVSIDVAKATLNLIPAEDYYEIEFVNSPTSKTYKAKVLKKKAKSFKVKAVSTNGEAVNYKLINAPEKIVINKTTGKITLKKGLKKGTYKIKVKAYIPKQRVNGYWAPETHAITIKVKK